MSTTPDRPDPNEPVDGRGSDEPHDTSNPTDDIGAQTDPAPGAAPVTEPVSERRSDTSPETAEQQDSSHAGSDQPDPASPPPPPPSSFDPPSETPAPPPPAMPQAGQPGAAQPPGQPTGPAPGTSPAYGAPAPGPAPAYGAPVGAPLSPQEEKGWSLAAHLLVLVGGFIAPLIIWLVFKGRGPFLEHHAKESLNFQITVTIALFAAIILTFLIVGVVLLLALIPWMVVMPILAAVKANNGEWYRYPLTLRLVK